MAKEKAAPGGVNPDTLKSNEIARGILATGVNPAGFRVVFENGVATLRGTVKTEDERQRVITTARANAGVREIKDELQIGQAAAPGSAASGRAPGGTYTVKKGDTLAEIAKQHYGKAGEYKKIFEANRDVLSDPDKIQPGQVLKLP